MGKKDFRMYENLALLSQVGLMMVIPIIGGLFIGKWLDGWLGTSPLLLLLCVLIGAASAFVNLYKFTMAAGRKDKRK